MIALKIPAPMNVAAPAKAIIEGHDHDFSYFLSFCWLSFLGYFFGELPLRESLLNIFDDNYFIFSLFFFFI